MIRVKLKIHGGGFLEIHGSPAARRVIVLLSRETFQKDDPMVARIIGFFTQRGETVIRYESRETETTRLIDLKCFWNLPPWCRLALNGLVLLFFPCRWAHFSKRHREGMRSIAGRVQTLRELLRYLGPEREVFLLTRSVSGRLATMVADQEGVRKVVCLGYPFQHPQKGPEPVRYAHLEGMWTPFLLFQGTRDAYGGTEILGKYRFSAGTTIKWIDTDHDFVVSEREWASILECVHGFFFGAQRGE